VARELVKSIRAVEELTVKWVLISIEYFDSGED